MIPADKAQKQPRAGRFYRGGRRPDGPRRHPRRDFFSAELTHESETISGGAVQIGNAITEKMLADVLLAASDRGLFSCRYRLRRRWILQRGRRNGGGNRRRGLARPGPLKYSGLSYTEIWISEAQERMVVAVPPRIGTIRRVVRGRRGRSDGDRPLHRHWATRAQISRSQVADLSMSFLHNGRPPVVREAVFTPPRAVRFDRGRSRDTTRPF